MTMNATNTTALANLQYESKIIMPTLRYLDRNSLAFISASFVASFFMGPESKWFKRIHDVTYVATTFLIFREGWNTLKVLSSSLPNSASKTTKWSEKNFLKKICKNPSKNILTKYPHNEFCWMLQKVEEKMC